MIKVYGIPNCDSVKKARKWLEANDISYEFHDFKKQGVPAGQLKTWLDRAGPEVVINRRGTTWRKLSEADKARAEHPESAIELLCENASVIKRPVIESGNELIIGFDTQKLEAINE